MDLNWHLQQIPFYTFKSLTLCWGVDPEDEETPGWEASVHLTDEQGDYIEAVFDETPSKAYEGLLARLIEEGYLEEAQAYGR
jgi:hypothetical protein